MPHRNTLKNVISDIVHRLQITCILVSHDPVDVLTWADEIIVMQDGRIVQQGTPEAIYHHSTNSYVAGLFGSFNIFSAETAEQFSALHNRRLPRFVRPEYLELTSEGNGIPAQILSQAFAGSYYELQIMSAGQTLTMTTTDPYSDSGETVFIRLKEQHLL
jgi:iron(III) transport system ATP-binding protein